MKCLNGFERRTNQFKSSQPFLGSMIAYYCNDGLSIFFHRWSWGFLWFKALIADLQDKEGRRKFLLRFEDSEETWNSLRKLKWRKVTEKPKVAHRIKDIDLIVDDESVEDVTGFVHSFEMEEDFLLFCDSLHQRREELGDKTRGDCAYGEALSGGLISVLIRREALPEPEREVYNRFSVKDSVKDEPA